MTVQVDTPQGLRSDYAVWEIKPNAQDHPIAGSGAELAFKGEEVAVDLPGGVTLFALLTSADGDPDYARQLP